MAGVALPSSGEARVSAVVALGWQVAKLYHSPVAKARNLSNQMRHQAACVVCGVDVV